MELTPLTCTAEQLYSVVSSSNKAWLRISLSNPAIHENHVLALLRNPAITPEIVHAICDRYEWTTSNKIQHGIVNCPRTPHPVALRFLGSLFWPDLMKTASNHRLSPRLRRAAENQLRIKIAELTLGEKMSLARTAPRAAIGFLRNEKDGRVMEALLCNPHLVEDDILVIVNNEVTPRQILSIIGADKKWSSRYPIRLALIRNRKTPLSTSLSFLSRLRKTDLQALVASPDASELVRRAASRLLTERAG